MSDTNTCPQVVAPGLNPTTINDRQSREIEKMGGWPLSPELTYLIFDHLYSHAACAVVSRQWQPLAEKYAFSTIVVTTRRVDDFHRLFQGGRRKHLRDIIVKQDSMEETWDSLLATLHTLLDHLGQWKEEDLGYGKGLCLVFSGGSCEVSHSKSRPLDISDSPVSIVGILKLGRFWQRCGENEFGVPQSELNLVQEVMRLTSRFPRLHTFAWTAIGARPDAWYCMTAFFILRG